MNDVPDTDDELLGLADTFPRPGWIVLDAIRDRRFTGEVAIDTTPETRVYADRGRMYLAERTSDPSLGARLVDAGVLNAAQLEHGTIRVGEGEHLGRLFERVPSVDRHAVLVMAELMTDACITWIAGQQVGSIGVAPYRFHPSGSHRWDRPFGEASLLEVPYGAPLPAPPPDAAPVDLGAPEPLFTPAEAFDADEMIQWNEPSWLDERPSQVEHERRAAGERAEQTGQTGQTGQPGQVGELEHAGGDWIDRLDTEGLPEPGSDPLATPVRLPERGIDTTDHFELIWPTGEIDEEFGANTSDESPDPDHDRVGPTARIVRDAARGPDEHQQAADAGPATVSPVVDAPADAPDQPVPAPTIQEAPREVEQALSDGSSDEAFTDEVVLAVRRAVASIETGSLAARKRIAESPTNGMLYGEPVLPGRLAARFDSSMPPAMAVRVTRPVSGSVFDDVASGGTREVSAAGQTTVVSEQSMWSQGGAANGTPTTETRAAEPGLDAPRTSALRRLIGSLRRR